VFINEQVFSFRLFAVFFWDIDGYAQDNNSFESKSSVTSIFNIKAIAAMPSFVKTWAVLYWSEERQAAYYEYRVIRVNDTPFSRRATSSSSRFFSTSTSTSTSTVLVPVLLYSKSFLSNPNRKFSSIRRMVSYVIQQQPYR